MEDVFGPDGLIARHHPNYEYRPGQVDMARAVHETLSSGGTALIEAGTGTGKTLAYLIPALAAGRRVIVSTATKNLQEQLTKKDIPFLQEIIPRRFNAVCMKGRSNYLCLHKLKKADQMPILEGLEEVDYFDEVRGWAGRTETGDRAELTDLPESLSFWSQIDARAESCLGQKCPEFDNCFVTRMRRDAQEADVVIVNHHLFFADLGLRGGDYGQVLPDYSAVIFDEAHEIEDVASSYFGTMVSNYRINELIQDSQKLVLTEPDRAADLLKVLARVSQRSDAFFMMFRGAGESWNDRGRRRGEAFEEGRYTIPEHFFVAPDRGGHLQPTAIGEAYIGLANAMERLIALFNIVKDPPVELENLIHRAEALKFELEFIVEGAEEGFVYWYERRGRGVFLNATPIDVSGILNEKLFSMLHSSVLTSATLTAGESFEFIRSRLGIAEAREVIVPSHFDFENQSVLYLPEWMPDPRSHEYVDASVEEIVEIIEATRGRAFVLFTSVSSMRETFERVRRRVDFPLLIQGQGSKSGLLERFRSTAGAVLFATSSFWQGVDVQGEALSCVIISKLPFAVPSDPVVAARQKYLDSQGGNSFFEYSVPQAIITLKQGLGRLIRSTSDRGVLSILDPRVRTKNYGRLFLQSIPQCRITSNIEEAAAIFD
jgi:ATP-dependent DNA helicase DinG